IWPHFARELRPFGTSLAIGLHLNLTFGAPLSAMPLIAPGGELPPLAELVRRALSGRLAGGEIRGEIARQLVAFRERFGRDPDFVDGHQHVHVLPGIRTALIAELSKRDSARPWLRDPSDQWARIVRRRIAPLKALAIAALAAGFGSAAKRAGLATNAGF